MAQTTTPAPAPAAAPAPPPPAAKAPDPVTYNVSGNLMSEVPAGKVPDLVKALITAVLAKPDATRAPALAVMWLASKPGVLSVTFAPGSEMTQAELAAVAKVMLSADPAEAALQAGSLGFDLKPPAA